MKHFWERDDKGIIERSAKMGKINEKRKKN